VRDGVNLERSGVPAIVISHNVFEKAAKAQANALGIPDLRILVYSQPKGEQEEVEGGKSALYISNQLITLLEDNIH
jgi:hypothetical protein